MKREQIKSLIEKVKMLHIQVARTYEWFKKNSVSTETVVGLSSAQVGELADYFTSKDYGFRNEIEVVITDYLKTQAFAQQHQVIINWDTAPKEATIAAVMTTWWNERGEEFPSKRYQNFEEKRPKPPSPTVEVGQVWIKDGIKYRIYGLDKVKSLGVKVDSVVFHLCNIGWYNDDFELYERTKASFLAKFERGGSE